jgi:hypothetical protein
MFKLYVSRGLGKKDLDSANICRIRPVQIYTRLGRMFMVQSKNNLPTVSLLHLDVAQQKRLFAPVYRKLDP